MRPWLFNGGTLVDEETYGVQRNAFEILCELDGMIGPGVAELVIPSGGSRQFSFRNISIVTLPATSKFRWNHWEYPRYVRKRGGLGIDLLLALPLWGCDVVEIYDCISEFFPQNASGLREKVGRWFYLVRVRNSTVRKRLLLTDSNNSKNDLVRVYGCDPANIEVVYCAWQHFDHVVADESVIARLHLEDTPFFFALGSRHIHKNFKWVMQAARQNPSYLFVVTGSNKLSKSDDELDSMAPKNMMFTGYLEDGEIKALMQRCKAFVQPSLYEGFGIPPMEAMSCGANCIVSKVSSLPEVYGDSVWYIDPNDYSDIDINAIMSRPKADNHTCLDRFSWRKSAEQLLDVLATRCE